MSPATRRSAWGEDFFDFIGEVFEGKGFLHKVDFAVFIEALSECVFCVAGDEDCFKFADFLSQPSVEGWAVDFWHYNVRDEQVDSCAAGDLKCFDAVCRFDYVVSFVFEGAQGKLSDCFFVFD